MYEKIPNITSEHFPFLLPIPWRNESHSFKYVVRRTKDDMGIDHADLLEVLEGDSAAWTVRTFTCADLDPSWTTDYLPLGIFIVEGKRIIRDCFGATDWCPEWVEVESFKDLSPIQLQTLKRKGSLR